jgi:FMN reductase
VETTPLIVGIGGTATPASSTEQALQLTLAAAESAGARTRLFGGAFLARLPLYLTTPPDQSPECRELIDAVRRADGVVIASPGYHGSISGLVKNAIDYLEETARDPRVYLDGVPVGLIATAYGWQAAANTLATLRSIVHALRGWPTPLGAAINSSGGLFRNGRCASASAEGQLRLLGQQVLKFVANRHGGPGPAALKDPQPHD